MLVSAAAMFKFIESPFIASSSLTLPSFRRTAIQLWSVIVVLVVITHTTFVLRGFDWRLPPEQRQLVQMQDFPDGKYMVPLAGPSVVALVGDSHAVQYEVGLSVLLHRLSVNMEILASPGCPMLYGVSLSKHPLRERCIKARDRALERLERNDLPIIFNQFWSFYDDSNIESEASDIVDASTQGSYMKLQRALEQTMREFVKRGHRVLLIGSQVDADCHFDRLRLYQGPLPHAALPPCLPGKREIMERSGAQMNGMLEQIRAKWPDNISLMRPVDYLCASECPTMDKGLWLYFDGTHFSVAGSQFMVQRAEKPLEQFLSSN
jgi:hypothetical protein